jgi:hypothetical protein
MKRSLQHLLTDLDQLTPEEQWQVMGHLMSQLQEGAVVIAKPDAPVDHQVSDLESQTWAEKRARAKQVLEATCGAWGNKTLDEIDAELDRQRQEDWGE